LPAHLSFASLLLLLFSGSAVCSVASAAHAVAAVSGAVLKHSPTDAPNASAALLAATDILKQY